MILGFRFHGSVDSESEVLINFLEEKTHLLPAYNLSSLYCKSEPCAQKTENGTFQYSGSGRQIKVWIQL